MSEDVLRRNLRVVDSAMRPNPAFVEELHARLEAELGLDGQLPSVDRVRPAARPQARRRSRFSWLAVAALLVLALLALLLVQQGRTPDVPPPSESPSVTPSATPSSQPSPLSSPTESTPPAIPESSPAFDNLRSDGLVVYERGTNGGVSQLRVLQPDLSSVELLPEVTDVQFGAAWRPDGGRLAYAGFDPAELRSQIRIWETDAAGSEPILLSEDCDPATCAAEYEPSYSPDGTDLVFVRTRVGEGAQEESVVAIRDLATGAVTELDATVRPRATAENLHPRWSPDGQIIAYGVTEYGGSGFPGNSTLHLIGADGTGERTISAPELHAGDPEWSPDGESILFASNPYRPKLRAFGGLDAPHLVGVMNADGSNARLFDYGRVMVAPTWTANGEQILFTLMEGRGTGENRPFNPRLFVMDLDGGNVLALTRDPGDAVFAVQQPLP